MLQANKQRKEKCVYACGVVVTQVGEGGGLYEVVWGSLTSESRSKGDVGTKEVDI